MIFCGARRVEPAARERETAPMTATLQEWRLRALDIAREPIAIIAARADAAPEIIYANGAFALLAGEDRAQPGQAFALFAPDAADRAAGRLRAALDQGRAATIAGAALRPDGSEHRLEVEIAPLSAPDAARAIAVVYLRPAEPARSAASRRARPAREDLALAALDAAADELAHVAAHARALAEAFPGAALFVDPTLRVRFADGEAFADIGVDPARLEGESIADIDADIGDELAAIARLALEGARLRFDFHLLDRVFEGLATPVRLDTGKLAGAMVALRDVTDARAAFEAVDAWPKSGTAG